MASAVWDADDILMWIISKRGQTISRTYASLLRQLKENIKIKRRGKLSKGVLFYQDNAPAHMSVIAMAAINDCGQHPYLPGLAQTDPYIPKVPKPIFCQMMTSYMQWRTF